MLFNELELDHSVGVKRYDFLSGRSVLNSRLLCRGKLSFVFVDTSGKKFCSRCGEPVKVVVPLDVVVITGQEYPADDR